MELGEIAPMGRNIWPWSKAFITFIEFDDSAAEHMRCSVNAWQTTLVLKQAAEALTNRRCVEGVFVASSTRRPGNIAGVWNNLLYAEGFTALQKVHVYCAFFRRRITKKETALMEALRLSFGRPDLMATFYEGN